MSEPVNRGRVGRGLARAFGSLAVAAAAAFSLQGVLPFSLGELALGSLAIVGVTQLIWIVPIIVHFRKRNEPETVKGVMIGAGIVALLNAACWGAVVASFA